MDQLVDVDEALAVLLAAAEVELGQETSRFARTDLGSDDLAALWRLVSLDIDGPGFDDFTSAVMDVCAAGWPEGSAPPDELGLRLGRWRIDLAKAGIRSGLLTAVIAGALVEQGMTEISIALVTAVLPTVFEIERIELSPKERMLLADLRLTPAMQTGWASEDDLYTALPAAAQEAVNRYDFADFIQRLREIGEIDEAGNGWMRIRPPL